MLGKNEILNYLQANKNYFESKFKIKKIGIFGSYARNEQTEESDIDILVLFDENADNLFGKRSELRDEIKAHFGKDVDVCHEPAIKPVFKKIVLQDAVYA